MVWLRRLLVILCLAMVSSLARSAEHPTGDALCPPLLQISTEDTSGMSYALGTSAFETSFTTQLPEHPGLYDAPVQTGSFAGCIRQINPMIIKYSIPSYGVDGSTGLLVILGGINATQDCNQFYALEPEMEAWIDSRNLIIAQVFYRNLGYWPPYDFGKYQIVDVLRGTGRMLSLFPQIDTRRLYLLGGSGGGHLALQVALISRHLWAEVYSEAAITRITTPADVAAAYPGDPSGGWNLNLGFPVAQSSLTDSQWRRYQAERDLRGPENSATSSAPLGTGGPWIRVLHGTADPTVDKNHLTALMRAVENCSGQTAVNTSPNLWEIENWAFILVPNGNHSFVGAPSGQNSRSRAIDWYFPEAFLRLRDEPPSLSVHCGFPLKHGFTFEVQGDVLNEVELRVQEAPATVSDWRFLLMPNY